MDNEREETLQERQEQEFIVLQSMYSSNLKDLRSKSEKKAKCPPKFCITLFPLHSSGHTSENSAQVDLHVTYGHEYPNQVPNIAIEDSKGLPKSCIEELLEELRTLAEKRRGDVMVHYLTNHVEDYLHKHNEPHYASFYDQMICNQKRQQEAEAIEKQKQKEQQRQKEEEEREVKKLALRKKQEALKEERKKELSNIDCSYESSLKTVSPVRKNSEYSVGNESPNLSRMTANFSIKSRQRGNSKSESGSSQDSCCACNHSCVAIYQFQSNRSERKIQRGKCLGHKRFGQNVVYFGVDLESGEPVAVTEWTLKWCHNGRKSDINDVDAVNIHKQLGSVEQELSSLSKLQHKNLVHYLGMKHNQEKNQIVIMVFQEFVAGSSLRYLLSENIPVEYQLLCHYIQGILNALSYLHKNSVVHKNLTHTSVFIESKGVVRVADYSLEKRLVEIYSSISKEDVEETFPPSVGRGGKKADIYRLGILCLSLAKGEMVNTMYPDIPNFLPPVLRDFLERCLTRQEQERWSADKLLEHSFLSPPIPREPSPGKEMEYEPDDKIVEQPSEFKPETLQPFLSGDHSSHSRLNNEFKVIDRLGQGGFGIVYKVTNILDGGVYAIKCIQLNPNNKKLNYKIMREVKLLSKLNHENVVRYYNSWIETKMVADSSIAEFSSEQDEFTNTTCISEMRGNGVLTPVQPKADSDGDWRNVSFNNQPNDLDDISSDEEEEEEDIYGTSFLPSLEETSYSIIFDNKTDEQSTAVQNNSSTEDNSSTTTAFHLSSQTQDASKIIQMMYIQMEFCDKSTLRTVIDGDLYKDENRVMRLFREIVEGLAHIHQQGMIHRDLKPGNIFLDSQDHVKIGDFGLATTNNLSQMDTHLLQHSGFRNTDQDTSQSEGAVDGSLTGWVGTVLYISPEVADRAPRAQYNQKVDIYSLGIIFFEMCFHPLNTTMERAIVLGYIRKADIIFPENFEKEKPQQAKIIKWLLDHDPNKRPTAQELLQSSYLPLQMEEAKLLDMLRHTVSNPQSKTFKHMISSLFKQDVSTVADVTYDFNMHKESFSGTSRLTFKFVVDTLVKVLRKHGAIPVACPLMMPKSSAYNKTELCVNLIDHSGSVVTLPYDLRVPFCRFAAKNSITSLKRYQIAPVYREHKVYGWHPRSQYECAFDIVTPSPGSLISDAEVLTTVLEMISEFPHLRNRRYLIRLNHTSLLKGIMLCCCIPEERHDDIYAVLNIARAVNLTKYQIVTKLVELNFSEESAESFCRLVEVEESLETIHKNMKPFLKRKGPGQSLIKQGFIEIEKVISNATAMGLKESVVVAPKLSYNIHHYSGIMFQIAYELKKKRKNLEVMAAGGRYDTMISRMRKMMDVTGNQDLKQSAVGVSIAVDKLVSALLEIEDFQLLPVFDALVCSLGTNPLLKEKNAIARELWNAGISTQIQNESLNTIEEIQDLCKEYCVLYSVILKDTEMGNIRVRWLDKDRYLEKKVQVSDLVDFLMQKRCLNRNDIQEVSTQNIVKMESNRLERSTSESIMTSNMNQHSVVFVTDEKLPLHMKRKYDAQIMSHLLQVLQNFSPKLCIEILAVDLSSDILNTIVTHLNMEGDENSFQNSLAAVTRQHPRYKKYFHKLFEKICQLKFEKKQPVLILYGFPFNIYKVIM